MTELDKAYNHQEVDSKWYKFWKDAGFFSADPLSSKEPYCIVMPPPNITGVLHMGHALVSTLQDTLIRWKRMQGFETLWVPGVDHAGIATQTVVEKKLIAKYGKRRKDFSRDEFLGHVWKWKEESEGSIIHQLKSLGCSCDWKRSRFTMDEASNQAVRTLFKKMYDEGLIYQGDYLVNWDPVTQTALADDEVEHEERHSKLWHIRYPLENRDDYLVVATTRPETMLGDTAVAVNPKDERYKHLIGSHVILPLTNRRIPIIADPYVDLAFGTGVVKITPAHDPNDYTMGMNHKLELINIMTPDGCINENGGEFKGLSMSDARLAIVKKLEQMGLIEKIEPHTHRVGLSYRSKAVIEPYLSKQWFIKMDGFAKTLTAAVDSGRVRLIPESWVNTYKHWITNLRDWCISRQLWWGHRIPIWYSVDNPEIRICSDSAELPPEVAKNPGAWRQDEDVLDTWFSSALWPFSTLGWPEDTDLLKRFYPNAVLITGHDILFFWVARMILMGEYALKEVPFPETFLHGLIYGKSYWREKAGEGVSYVSEEERAAYDLGLQPVPKDVKSRWEKMSKSKGNIIDPLEVIKQYGTDAIRLALCVSGPQAREIDLDRRRFEEFLHFTNKIWNGARFIFMNVDGEKPLNPKSLAKGLNLDLLALEDRWILSLMNRAIARVNKSLEEYAFDQAALSAYDFFWKELCAYYVEIVKPILTGKHGTPERRENTQKVLVILLCSTLRLLHPFAPFITEELFQKLKHAFQIENAASSDAYTRDCLEALSQKACIVASYPISNPKEISEDVENSFKLIEKVVYSIRNIRGEMKLPPNLATDIFFVGADTKVLQEHKHIISALVRCKELHFSATHLAKTFGATGVVDSTTIFIPLPEELIAQEGQRLQKERERLESSIEKLEIQLKNPQFTERAPQALVSKQQELLKQAQDELLTIHEKLRLSC